MLALPIAATLPYHEHGSQSPVFSPPTGGLNTIEHLAQLIGEKPQHPHKKPLPDNHVLTPCTRLLAFTTDGQVVGILCGKWSCPYCAKLNARLWAWRVKLHLDANSGQNAYFWTLTMRGKYHDAQTAFAALPNLWNTFRMAVQRDIGKWTYCAFVEGQPRRDYMPHFHIISMAKAPRRLKDLAMQAGFGYQATETLVSSGKAGQYVAKYASKQSSAMPKNFRRVRCSQDWAKLPSFTGDPLIVKSRNETTTHYILRVNELTAVPVDDLLERWQDAWEVRSTTVPCTTT